MRKRYLSKLKFGQNWSSSGRGLDKAIYYRCPIPILEDVQQNLESGDKMAANNSHRAVVCSLLIDAARDRGA